MCCNVLQCAAGACELCCPVGAVLSVLCGRAGEHRGDPGAQRVLLRGEDQTKVRDPERGRGERLGHLSTHPGEAQQVAPQVTWYVVAQAHFA